MNLLWLHNWFHCKQCGSNDNDIDCSFPLHWECAVSNIVNSPQLRTTNPSSTPEYQVFFETMIQTEGWLCRRLPSLHKSLELLNDQEITLDVPFQFSHQVSYKHGFSTWFILPEHWQDSILIDCVSSEF